MPLAGSSSRLSSWRYIFSMWPLLLIFAFIQLTMRLTGNSASIGLPLWISGMDLMLFLVCFGIAAFWIHWPVARLGKRLEGRFTQHHKVLEAVMAEQPWRALKALALTGMLYGTYLMALILVAAAVNDVLLTPRMILALGICFYFTTGVLAPALGVAKTIAYSTHLRRKLVALGAFSGDLEDAKPLRALTGSARRPWLVFFVTGLFPTTLLALYVYLALGVSDPVEQQFIISQALVLFVAAMLSGAYLTYTISNTLALVTKELASGLAALRQGNYGRKVPVLTDDDLGDLARGLNTALKGLQERDDLKGTLEIASEIQQGILPREAPQIPGYDLYGFQKSCYAVGGDYYDHIQVTGGTYWLIVADVAGKGYPAALTVANLQAMLHALAASRSSLGDAAGYINNALCENLRGGRFVSLFLAELRSGAHDFAWLNAGHVPPLLYSAGNLRILEASAPPMGLDKNLAYKVNHERLVEGDAILAYSDGVTEARGRNGTAAGLDVFGERRLADWFMAHHAEPLDQMPKTLLKTIEEFGQMTREDDLTLLGLRRRNHGED